MLAAVEHGLLARIAAAMIGIQLDVVRRGGRRTRITVDRDIGNAADLRPIRLRHLAIGGIVSALRHARSVVRLERTVDARRIVTGDISAVPVIRPLKIGIRILRLHRALHKGGKKRCRLPREDAPSLVRAALVGDVPFVIG